MPLTAESIKRAKAKNKPYKLHDEKSLYLLINTKGGKYWRMKYRFADKENTFAIGVYPQISLKAARLIRDESRTLLAKGIDLNQDRKEQKSRAKAAKANAFKVVSLDWHGKQAQRWKPVTVKKKLWFIERFLLPTLGTRPINDIKPADILELLSKIESKGTLENVRRTKQIASAIFRYGVASGICDNDPTRDIGDALIPKKTKHHAAIIDPKGVGQLIYRIGVFTGTPEVHGLLKMSYLTLQRPGEVRQMRWSEVNLEEKQWELHQDQKQEIPQIIPLSKQAMEVINALQPLTSHSPYVFLSPMGRQKPLSHGAVKNGLRRMGYGGHEMTAHGFRALGRTLLDEALESEPHLIEQQLSHVVRDPLGRAYNRTKHVPQRRTMMQNWADYLDALAYENQHSNVIAGSFNQREK